jgi:hypothetical protein
MSPASKPDGGSIERELRYLARAVPDLPNATSVRLIEDPGVVRQAALNLTAAEHERLLALPGADLRKVRYRIPWSPGSLALDVFEGPLEGLVMAEAELDREADALAFAQPAFAAAEVTHDERFCGGTLATAAPGQAADWLGSLRAAPGPPPPASR